MKIFKFNLLGGHLAMAPVMGKEYVLVTYRAMFTLEMFLFQGVHPFVDGAPWGQCALVSSSHFDLTVFAELIHSMMNKGFVSFGAAKYSLRYSSILSTLWCSIFSQEAQQFNIKITQP